MKVTPVFDATKADLDPDFLNQEFDSEGATPFPLQAVLKRLYIADIQAGHATRETDAMELAVIFANTFDESISVSQVRKAQQRTDNIIKTTGKLGYSRRALVMIQLVEAFGRDYAYTRSPVGQLYDLFKWKGLTALDKIGDLTLSATDHLVSSLKNAGATLRQKLKQPSPPRTEDTTTD